MNRMKSRLALSAVVALLAALVWLVTQRDNRIPIPIETVRGSVPPQMPQTVPPPPVEVARSEGEASASDLPAAAPARGDAGPTSSTRIERFLDPQAKIVPLEAYVRERLSEDDLPGLYAALKDEKYARKWNNVMMAICVLEDDEKAFEVVKTFASTPWDWESGNIRGHEATLVIRGIITTIVNLAQLDPDISGPFLAETFTRDGAERFLKGWEGYTYPEDDLRELLVEDLMFCAASGLIHTRVPAYNKLVEDKAHEIHAIPKEARSYEEAALFASCRQLLGWRMLYEEMGWDNAITYLHNLSTDSALDVATSYTGKYTRHLIETSGITP
jgi:hypothetical protein